MVVRRTAPPRAVRGRTGPRRRIRPERIPQTAPHRQVQRAKALLLAADGVANLRIAAQVGVKPATVRAWGERAMTGLAVSWLSQNPELPIFSSSSLRRVCLAGKSKRVPDGDHPGRKRFDRGREVFVNHGLTIEAMSAVFKFQRETHRVLKI